MKYLLLIGLLICNNFVKQQFDKERKRTTHYYERIAAFKKEDAIGKEDIVFLGNSLIEKGGNWGKKIGIAKVKNRGIIGDDLSGITERIEPIIKGSPKAIFIIAGINDLSHNLNNDSILYLYERLIVKIKKESPQTTLFIHSLLPINEEFKRYKRLDKKSDSIPIINIGLKKIAAKRKVHFINIYPLFGSDKNKNMLNIGLTYDGLHLNEKGYAIWIKEIKKYINK